METTYGNKLTPRSLGAWAWAMIRHPWQFFRGVSLEGGYGVAVLYLLFWEGVASGVTFLLSFLPGGAVVPLWVRGLLVVVGPAAGLVAGFLMAALLFVLWHLMGSPHPYKTAFRCWALMAPLSLIGALAKSVPYLFLGVLVYGFFLLVVASVETHRIPARRAWTVWSLVGAGLLVFIVTAVIVNVVRSRSGGFPGGVSSAPWVPPAAYNEPMSSAVPAPAVEPETAPKKSSAKK